MTMREEAEWVMRQAISDALPDEAVKRALMGRDFGNGRLFIVAAGKAAWQMAQSALEQCGERVEAGIVITKYGHIKGELPKLILMEAGHPVPDENSYLATQKALELVGNLKKEDTVLFLLSGGGSALFEKPLISGEEMQTVTQALLSCGADIVEMNTIRKRLSAVKGGRFAQLVSPAHILTVVLSDIIGDPLDMIASGPAYPDHSTCAMARAVVQKYHLSFSDRVMALLNQETPKKLENVETIVTGSVRILCESARESLQKLNYEVCTLTSSLNCEARQAGFFLASIAREKQNCGKNLAFLAGGETVVHLTGKGKGGRNQEIALAAAQGIEGMEHVAVFSFGSDGTDGPTDAAGGYADGRTAARLRTEGMTISAVLEDNNAYPALKRAGGLLFTGPTGTNVNDLSVVLIRCAT